VGQLRGDFWSLLFTGDLDKTIEISQKSFAQMKKYNVYELRNAALTMEAYDLLGRMDWGAGFWNALVFQYVPGQIVGFEVKKSLQIGIPIFPYLYYFFNYKVPTGSTLTGLADSYAQFSWLGCLIFGAIGRVYKTVWASIYRGSMFSVLLYIGIISPAMVGVTHSIGTFLQGFTFNVGVMWLISKYAGISFRYQHNRI
jgi:hypothetical protein